MSSLACSIAVLVILAPISSQERAKNDSTMQEVPFQSSGYVAHVPAFWNVQLKSGKISKYWVATIPNVQDGRVVFFGSRSPKRGTFDAPAMTKAIESARYWAEREKGACFELSDRFYTRRPPITFTGGEHKGKSEHQFEIVVPGARLTVYVTVLWSPDEDTPTKELLDKTIPALIRDAEPKSAAAKEAHDTWGRPRPINRDARKPLQAEKSSDPKPANDAKRDAHARYAERNLDLHASDPKMEAAAKQAKATVDDFVKALNDRRSNCKNFAVRVPLTEVKTTEHVWLVDVSFAGGFFKGRVKEAPKLLQKSKRGDTITVVRDHLSDWMYVDNGRLVGGFTIRALRERLAAKQRSDFDATLPYAIEDKP